MGDVSRPSSSRVTKVPLFLGKRNKFLATRFHQWVNWFLVQQQPKKASSANSLISSLLPWSGPGQGCKHRAGAVCPGCWKDGGAGGARDHTGQPWSFYKCIFSPAVPETTFMAKFWMSLLWAKCLGPVPGGFGHFRKSELEWQLMICCPRGRHGFVSSIPTLCMAVPLHWLTGVVGISVSGFASLNLGKNSPFEKTVGVQIAPWLVVGLHIKLDVLAWLRGTSRCVLVQEERARAHVPGWGGEERAVWVLLAARVSSGGSPLPIRPCSGSMLPSSAALEKFNKSQALLTESLHLPKALVRGVLPWLGAESSCVHTCGSVSIQYTQLRHLQLLCRICMGFQQ